MVKMKISIPLLFYYFVLCLQNSKKNKNTLETDHVTIQNGFLATWKLITWQSRLHSRRRKRLYREETCKMNKNQGLSLICGCSQTRNRSPLFIIGHKTAQNTVLLTHWETRYIREAILYPWVTWSVSRVFLFF